MKREYNVDENRVVVSGVSDGGTGAYYVAMRDTTPYASFLPLNGYVLVLRSPELQISGSLFLNNLRNKPLYIVNGGKDPLYPMDTVEPSLVPHECRRRADRLPAAAGGRPRHELVAGGQGRLRERSCARIRACRCPTS